MINTLEKLKGFKEGYVRHALLSNKLGMALYSYENRHEIYEFFVDEDKFLIEDESKIATIPDGFDFTCDMFEDWVEQRRFELSSKEEQEQFKAFPTVLASLDEFKEKRPHILYKNNEILTGIENLISDDGSRRHRCGNCGYPFYQSWTKFEYKGGEEGLEASNVSQINNIVCSCCGREAKDPVLYIGDWGDGDVE